MAEAKWADYWISQVKFNAKHTHIDMVRIHPDNGDTFWSYSEHTRADILKAIDNKITFVTITKDVDWKWKKWQRVFPIMINRVMYIKTVDNGKELDNLDNLPEF